MTQNAIKKRTLHPLGENLFMYKFLLFVVILFSAVSVEAQIFKVHGKILNGKQEALPFVTIRVKETQAGLMSKQDGSYELSLVAGNYHLVLSMIGYKSQEIPIAVNDNLQKDIILEEESQNLSEVVVKARVRDRAEEIMRQVIRKKDSIQAAAGAYSCKVYIKAVQENSRAKDQEKDQGNLSNEDWKGMAMAEILLQLDKEGENKIREERLAVKKSGNTKRLFYQSVTEGNFNFYDNLVKVPAISPTPFVSPISYSGLVAYKFKTTKIKRSGKHRIYTFSVKPLQVTNATIEGELTVSDSAWVVLHSRFRFPRYHLQEYEFFEVEQEFDFVNNKAWMLTHQQFAYKAGGNNKRAYTGKTDVTFSDHQLNKQFGRRHFSNEISATAAEAYERDSTFWQTARSRPLSEREAVFSHYQDSLYQVSLSHHYQDSLDKVINKITWKKLGLFGQSFRDHRKERILHLSPLVSLYKPFAFGGGRFSAYASYSKTFTSRKNININTDLSYGIRNSDVNGNIELSRLYNPFSRGVYRLSAGRDFAFIYEGDAWINLIKRNNIYLNNYVGAGHGIDILNGLVLNTDAEIAFRRSVNEYKTGKLVDSVLGNMLDDNRAIAFQPYNAFYSKIKLQYTPAQRYRREPKEKIIIGSKFPTFYVLWEKGVPGIVSSKVDFDYLEFGVEQRMNLGLLGMSKYTIKTGEYLNQENLRLIDYKFQRRGDPLMFMNPHKAFQSLDSTFPVFKRFYEGHFFHEFNGLFLNKIPLFKKLQLREVGGGGFLFAQERNLQYAELFVGVERAFQSPFNPLDRFKIGVYVVGAAANQFRNPVQFKVGFTTWDKRRNRWY